MADPAQQMQNMNLQGLDFDPYAPQSNHVPEAGDPGSGPVSNGLEKCVTFEDGGIDAQHQDQDVRGDQGGGGLGFYNTRGSSGDMAGFQHDFTGFQDSGQMEYVGDSGEEGEEEEGGNVVFSGGPTGGQPGSENSYYAQTGQPLVDMGGADNSVGFVNQDSSGYREDVLGTPMLEGDASGGAGQGEEFGDTEQQEYYDEYDRENMDPSLQGFEPDLLRVSPARLRRSESPERSLSPTGDSSQALSATSPEADSEPSESCDSVHHAQKPSGMKLFSPIPSRSPRQTTPAEDSDSSPARTPEGGRPKARPGLPRPQGSPRMLRGKKPLELPPWNDNVVIPKPKRPMSTMIGKKADVSPPPRPRTAPARKPDGSSDSGVEEEKSPRKSSADSKKRYGVDAKNDRYKPGGGNIKIFSEKVETKGVGSRIDTKPKVLVSPRRSRESSTSSLNSPSPTGKSSPAVKNVQSKIGSMNNIKHSPGGGNVQVLDTKVDYSKVGSKVGSKDKLSHKPMGGEKKIQTEKLTWKKESKVGSLDNMKHTPRGGNIKVPTQQLLWKSESKVGSLDNAKYTPGGGNVKPYHELQTEELDWDTDAKVNSLENIDYEPGGGNVKIFSEKLEWHVVSKIDSMSNIHFQPAAVRAKQGIDIRTVRFASPPRINSMSNIGFRSQGGKKRIQSHPIHWSARSQVNSMDNINYKPGGGNVKIQDQKIEIKAEAKVGSTKNLTHQPGGGDKKIETQKLTFKESAAPKVGSMDQVKHKPGGGDVKIVNERLDWSANPKIKSLEKADYKPGGGNVKILNESVNFQETAKPKIGSMEKVQHQPGGGDRKSRSSKRSHGKTASKLERKESIKSGQTDSTMKSGQTDSTLKSERKDSEQGSKSKLERKESVKSVLTDSSRIKN